MQLQTSVYSHTYNFFFRLAATAEVQLFQVQTRTKRNVEPMLVARSTV